MYGVLEGINNVWCAGGGINNIWCVGGHKQCMVCWGHKQCMVCWSA